MTKLNKALTWEDLAGLYNSEHGEGRSAQTLPMELVFAWAERQTDKFKVCEDGTIHKIN